MSPSTLSPDALAWLDERTDRGLAAVKAAGNLLAPLRALASTTDEEFQQQHSGSPPPRSLGLFVRFAADRREWCQDCAAVAPGHCPPHRIEVLWEEWNKPDPEFDAWYAAWTADQSRALFADIDRMAQLGIVFSRTTEAPPS